MWIYNVTSIYQARGSRPPPFFFSKDGLQPTWSVWHRQQNIQRLWIYNTSTNVTKRHGCLLWELMSESFVVPCWRHHARRLHRFFLLCMRCLIPVTVILDIWHLLFFVVLLFIGEHSFHAKYCACVWNKALQILLEQPPLSINVNHISRVSIKICMCCALGIFVPYPLRHFQES